MENLNIYEVTKEVATTSEINLEETEINLSLILLL